MIEQTARVISIKQGYAWVLPEQSAGCGSCHTQSACSGLGSFFSFLKPRSERLYVQNPLHAKPGDEVVLGMQGNALVVYALLAYLLPLVSMLVFAILGGQVAEWGGIAHELGSVLAGVAGLYSGMRLAAWLAEGMHKSIDSYPVILRHKEHAIYPIGTSISHI